jgi:hypothetical protein
VWIVPIGPAQPAIISIATIGHSLT